MHRSQNLQVKHDATNLHNEDIDPAVRVQLASLQAQLNALQNSVLQQIQDMINNNSDNEGNPGQSVGQGGPAEMMLTNKSGAARNLGDVIVADTSTATAFTTTTTMNNESVIGVVATDSADGTSDAVAIDADCRVRVRGRCKCYVDADAAAISIGDYLITHTTAGYARKAQSVLCPGIFARALEAKASGTGRIIVELNPYMEFRNYPESQAFDFKPGYDLDGSVTGFSGYLMSAASRRVSATGDYIQHDTYHYNVSGLLQSSYQSSYNVDGTGAATLKYAITYAAGMLDEIIKTLES